MLKCNHKKKKIRTRVYNPYKYQSVTNFTLVKYDIYLHWLETFIHLKSCDISIISGTSGSEEFSLKSADS